MNNKDIIYLFASGNLNCLQNDSFIRLIVKQVYSKYIIIDIVNILKRLTIKNPGHIKDKNIIQHPGIIIFKNS